MTAAWWYYYILQYCPLIPLLAGAPNFKKLDPPLRVLLYYTALSLLLTIAMTVIALHRLNNLWLMNFSEPVEFAMLLWMFQCWESDSRLRTLIRSLIIPYLLAWFYEVIAGGRWFGFTTYARPIEGIVLTFVACLTIYRVNRNLNEPITDKPSFWVSAGTLLYYGGVIIIDLVSESLLEKSDETLRQVLLLQVTLNFFSQILYLIAFRSKIKGSSAGVEEALA